MACRVKIARKDYFLREDNRGLCFSVPDDQSRHEDE